MSPRTSDNYALPSFLDCLEAPPTSLFTPYRQALETVWKAVEASSGGCLAQPRIILLDYSCLFRWEDSKITLDIEIEFNKDLHWFCYNKEENEYLGSEEAINYKELPENLISLLKERREK